MSDDTLVVERPRPAIALLRFNRPAKLNAVDQATFGRLHDTLEELDRDRSVRVVILTGTGRAFSAGADLGELDRVAAAGGHTVRDAHRMLHRFQAVTRLVVEHHAIVIAAVNGIAVGVGAELALAADLRLGTPKSELMLSEVKRGLFETNGVMHLLPRIVGHGRAAQWLLTGERVAAPALLASGFLNELVEPERLMDRSLELAETIVGNAPISVGLVKRLLRRTWEVDLETMMQYEIDGMMACLASEDLEVGVKAFVAKRAPEWLGR
ncbi:MAG: enoyl-CoA hydratase/isomerase family protein [Gemmatimonadales bacterium]